MKYGHAVGEPIQPCFLPEFQGGRISRPEDTLLLGHDVFNATQQPGQRLLAHAVARGAADVGANRYRDFRFGVVRELGTNRDTELKSAIVRRTS